jgi:membrane protease YdiL (CAAX protease family)
MTTKPLPFRDTASLFARTHALSFAFIVLITYLSLLTAPDLFGSKTFNKSTDVNNASDIIKHLPFEAILLLSIVILTIYTRLWSAIGIKTFAQAHLNWVLGALSLPSIVLLISGLQLIFADSQTSLFTVFPLSGFALLALMSVFIAAFEELLFRGVLQNGISQSFGELKAVVFTALVFGLAHYANWVHGKPFLETSVQVVTAFSAGLLLGALRITTKSIWPAIIVHAAWDFSVFFMSKVNATVSTEHTDSDVVIASVLVFVIIAKPVIATLLLLTHITETRREIARSVNQ